MAKLSQPIATTSEALDLSLKDRDALAQALWPEQRITNFIWATLVVAVAIVLVGSAGGMIWIFIQKGELNPGAMLTVFTTVMGFVAGLLIKSPVRE